MVVWCWVAGLVIWIAEVDRGYQLKSSQVSVLALLLILRDWSCPILKPCGTLSSFIRPRLDSPIGRFSLDFMLLANYIYLGVSLALSNDMREFIWYAIRAIPFANYFDEFILENKDEALRIRGQGGILITLCSFATNNTVATLLDFENFIFNDVYPNGSTKRALWQSFDHLADMLIPGMKLGVNHKTGQNWSLTARLTSNILNSGAFTLEWTPNGLLELFIKHRGVVHWKCGVLYDFNVVSNGDEVLSHV
ncbi:g-type lectin s-receptor-like serine/threonine-protein kinase [Quercus suber]|uniref:G-type lectin s-receptor-like serine/threonine-protein kinase n=1 Tax=Quercus suber TaxID=58331 RepID=A0AAW0J0W0_QUESU